MKTRPWFCGAAIAAAIFKTSAQDFTLDWSAVAGGGGQSSGGDFSLEGTVGQPDAGALSGGDFELSGGYWSIIAALNATGTPVLTLTASGGQVVLWWPVSDFVFVIEEATALATPPNSTFWRTVDATPQVNDGMEVVVLPLASGNRFYRLRQQ